MFWSKIYFVALLLEEMRYKKRISTIFSFVFIFVFPFDLDFVILSHFSFKNGDKNTDLHYCFDFFSYYFLVFFYFFAFVFSLLYLTVKYEKYFTKSKFLCQDCCSTLSMSFITELSILKISILYISKQVESIYIYRKACDFLKRYLRCVFSIKVWRRRNYWWRQEYLNLSALTFFTCLKPSAPGQTLLFQKMFPAIFFFLLQYFEPWALQQISGGLNRQGTPYDIFKKVPITTTHTVVV